MPLTHRLDLPVERFAIECLRCVEITGPFHERCHIVHALERERMTIAVRGAANGERIAEHGECAFVVGAFGEQRAVVVQRRGERGIVGLPGGALHGDGFDKQGVGAGIFAAVLHETGEVGETGGEAVGIGGYAVTTESETFAIESFRTVEIEPAVTHHAEIVERIADAESRAAVRAQHRDRAEQVRFGFIETAAIVCEVAEVHEERRGFIGSRFLMNRERGEIEGLRAIVLSEVDVGARHHAQQQRTGCGLTGELTVDACDCCCSRSCARARERTATPRKITG